MKTFDYAVGLLVVIGIGWAYYKFKRIRIALNLLFGLAVVVGIATQVQEAARVRRIQESRDFTKQLDAMVLVTTNIDLQKCPAKTPIAVEIRNTHKDRTVYHSTFVIGFFQKQHSDNLLKTTSKFTFRFYGPIGEGRIEDDRIVKPGESYSRCLALPERFRTIAPLELTKSYEVRVYSKYNSFSFDQPDPNSVDD